MYQQSHEKITIDGEWWEDELRGNVHDICIQIMTPKILQKYEYRALKNKDLLKPQYMAEQILNEIDVVELYDNEYKKHNQIYDIELYDVAIATIVEQKLEENIVK